MNDLERISNVFGRVSATRRMTVEDLHVLQDAGVDIVDLVREIRTPGERPPRTHRTGPRTPAHAPGVHVDGQDAPDASTGRTRNQAHQAAHHAQTQGGQAGIASGLAAIALAILAGQEQDR